MKQNKKRYGTRLHPIILKILQDRWDNDKINKAIFIETAIDRLNSDENVLQAIENYKKKVMEGKK